MFFQQIKRAGEHDTPWQGYQFDKVGMYLIHAEDKQVKNAYIVNAKEPIPDAVALDKSYGITVQQFNEMSLAAHDKLLAGNGLFDFYYKIKNNSYYLQNTQHRNSYVIMNALLILINEVITLYLYTLFVYVIMSLLIQFQMINSYNKIINTIFRALISLHEPLLGKIRQYIPSLSGIDLSPVIVILLLSFLKNLIQDYRLGL